jgi:hypothetical protein
MTELQKIAAKLRRKDLTSEERDALERRRNELLVMQSYRREADYDARQAGRRRNPPKRPKKGKLSKRVPAAMSKWIRKQNPAMNRATAVRVKKLKGGGVTITPVR